MEETRPFLLLRARPRSEDRDEFRRWFKLVHLRDVGRIPGFSSIEWGETATGTTLGIYTFESAETVQPTLNSPQAAYARGTWEQWGARLEEFLIEMYAPLFPLPIYQSAN
jgi:hypothetical protein